MGKAPHAFPDALKMAGKSSWSWTFHTYGLAITETDTVAYDSTNWPTFTHTRAYNHWRLDGDSIASIYFGHSGQLCNGTTIEIYAR